MIAGVQLEGQVFFNVNNGVIAALARELLQHGKRLLSILHAKGLQTERFEAHDGLPRAYNRYLKHTDHAAFP